MKKTSLLFLVFFSAMISCGGGGGGGNSNVTLSMVGFKSTVSGHSLSVNESAAQPSFTHPVTYAAGYINSAAPEYIKITMTKISVLLEGGTQQQIWSGSKEITVDGSTAIDVSDVTSAMSSIPAGTVKEIIVSFSSKAKVKGSITGPFSVGTLTVYTKADASYNAVDHTGGNSAYSHFTTGAAEEADFYIGASSDDLTVTTASNYVVTAGTPIKLTILFDINRLLRFYDGLGSQGFNPPDPSNKAYFSGHSLLGGFIASFFGTPGKIEGYKTYYSVHSSTSGAGHYEGVYGWMTMVYDADGNFLSGILMGDDDNALTCAKGLVTTYTKGSSSDTFRYDISNVEVTDFKRVTTLNYYSDLATINSFADNTGGGTTQTFTGEACYQLLFTQ